MTSPSLRASVVKLANTLIASPAFEDADVSRDLARLLLDALEAEPPAPNAVSFIHGSDFKAVSTHNLEHVQRVATDLIKDGETWPSEAFARIRHLQSLIQSL